ncbi:hypothetical protein CH63R_00245 [Colletotrichum higginsianum IMI 349063]|uniref:Uncharacterized protein n=1 Tax=Colletotrichum higginsianum (strain IMI 349063) TaxID=759273 RepID=A0A1B7YSN7_COLHI|nr:hypothetical protein CH63R_00245 [Colletotrichum higginsianum IMI 349063]OBR15065.1 hypothetical protein CH63R_00245 [Colletotrichum higginsianum IMI 349063]
MTAPPHCDNSQCCDIGHGLKQPIHSHNELGRLEAGYNAPSTSPRFAGVHGLSYHVAAIKASLGSTPGTGKGSHFILIGSFRSQKHAICYHD